jgi:hypothetical protein
VTDTGVFTTPVAGSTLISVRVRVPDVTENAFGTVMVSAPLTVTLRVPILAPGLIARDAIAVPFG